MNPLKRVFRRLLNGAIIRSISAISALLPLHSRPAQGSGGRLDREQLHIKLDDHYDEAEIDSACFAGQRVSGETYRGPRTNVQEQVAALSRASGKGRLYAMVIGDELTREREEFIAARMKDL